MSLTVRNDVPTIDSRAQENYWFGGRYWYGVLPEMKTIRLVESEWGGQAHEAIGPLLLYGFQPETVSVGERQQLLGLCDDAQSAKVTTLLLLGQGFLNQLGQDLPQQVPDDSQQLKVIWIGVDPGGRSSARYRVPADGAVSSTVLKALGESTGLLNDVLSSINATLKPRFDDAVLSGVEFSCYDQATDLELHLPVIDVRDHFHSGDLRQWLQGLVQEADEANA